MSLGLSQLTDDQLFNLCQEMCAELTQRDPYIRRCAQQEIIDAAERLRVQREAVSDAVEAVRNEYVDSIRKDVLEEVRSLAKKGEIRILNVQQEAAVISESDRQAKLQLMAELEKATKNKLMPARLNIALDGKRITVRHGSREFTVNTNMTADQAVKLVDSILGEW